MVDKPPLPSSFDESPEFSEETSFQKFKRRLRQEPLIPLGCAATCYALYRAYRSMKARDSVEVNRMFRARIYAQAFTLCAVVAGGAYYKTERQQRREFEKALEDRKAQEKRDTWLRELEARDKEDQGWRERHAKIEEAAKAAGKPQQQQQSLSSSKQLQQSPQKEEQKSAVIDKDTSAAPKEEGDEKQEGGVLNAVKALIGKK